MKGTRVAFVIVSIVTIFLLVGSVVLQRIVFSAAESSSDVYLSPSSFIVQPNGQVDLDIVASFSIPAYIASAQFVVTYDRQRLEYQDIDVSSGFGVEGVDDQSGRTNLLVVPGPAYGIVGEYSGTIRIATLSFKALSAGPVNVELDPRLTRISAIDPEGQYALYNPVISVQNTFGEISTQTSTRLITPPPAGEAIAPSPSLVSTQRIVHSNISALSDQALMIFNLRYIGGIRVDYGTNSQLSNSINTTTTNISHLLRLRNLEENTRYFYRVSVFDADGQTALSWPVRSFTTGELNEEGSIDPRRSELIAVSPVTNRSTLLTFVPRDSEGNLVSPGSVNFRVKEGEASLSLSSSATPTIISLATLINTKQTVVIEAIADDAVVASSSVVFDPSLATEMPPRAERPSQLTFNQNVQMALVFLLMLMLVSALALIRLIRLK